MPVFIWEGKTRTGDVKKGEVEAVDAATVERLLSDQQITASKIKKKPKEFVIKMPGASGVPTKDLVVFTRTFATMVDAGLPIVQAIDILASQEPNVFFKNILKDIKASVETGSTLAEALGRHPKVFSTLYVNLVAAGEVGGALDTILDRLAIYLEKAEKLKQKIKSALMYPTIVTVIAIGVVILMLWKVIPTFEEMFSSFGDGSLPGPTQFVVDLSRSFGNNAVFIFLGIGLFIAGFIYVLKNKKTRLHFDTYIMKFPVIGPVLRKAAVARFTRTFGTMVQSGVPMLDALDITARASGNMAVEKAIIYTREKIAEGRTLAEPLSETKIFPEMVVQMINVGETTGALDTMLNKIADFYEEEVDAAVESTLR